MGISFTFYNDLLPSLTNNEIKSRFPKAKHSAIICAGIAFLAFMTFDQAISGGGDLFINLLLTFYSAVLAFTPVMISAVVFRKRATQPWPVLSVVFGSTAGILVGFYAVLFDPAIAWFPVIVSLTISSVVYIVGLAFSSIRIEDS